jgi:hypothetical protein
VIGTDLIKDLDKWDERLTTEVKFIVFERNGYLIDKSQSNWPRNYKIATTEHRAVSSTKVRTLVREGQSIKGLVTKSVDVYISSHKLYKWFFAKIEVLFVHLKERRCRCARAYKFRTNFWRNQLLLGMYSCVVAEVYLVQLWLPSWEIAVWLDMLVLRTRVTC